MSIRKPKLTDLPKIPATRCTVCWRELDPTVKTTPRRYHLIVRPDKEKPDYCSTCAHSENTRWWETAARLTHINAATSANPTPTEAEEPDHNLMREQALCQHPDHQATMWAALDTEKDKRLTVEAVSTCIKCPVFTECLKQSAYYNDQHTIYAGLTTPSSYTARNMFLELGYTVEDMEPLARERAEQLTSQLCVIRESRSESVKRTCELVAGTNVVYPVRFRSLSRFEEYLNHAPTYAVIQFKELKVAYMKTQRGWQAHPGGDYKRVSEIVEEVSRLVDSKYGSERQGNMMSVLQATLDATRTLNPYAEWKNPDAPKE